MKVSNAVFLSLLQSRIQAVAESLHEGGMLRRTANDACAEHCPHRYELTKQGEATLSHYLSQLNALARAEIQASLEVQPAKS